jgi:hypothetical protein
MVLGGRRSVAQWDPLFLPLSFLKLREQYFWENRRGGKGETERRALQLGVTKIPPVIERIPPTPLEKYIVPASFQPCGIAW